MISITRSGKDLTGTIDLTPSKSITNRVLIIRALCGENFEIWNSSGSDDSVVLRENLETLRAGDIYAGDSGTAYRFLVAYLSNQPGQFRLSGSDRMHQRPIAPLVDALRSVGADITYSIQENFPPLIIHGKQLEGGRLTIDSTVSSQFVSALLLIAPYFTKGLDLELSGKTSSEPYIDMTIGVMKQFDVHVVKDHRSIQVSPQKYLPEAYLVENDWSAASFWYIMAAISESATLFLKGLRSESLQGDRRIAEIMKMFGIETTFNSEGAEVKKVRKEMQMIEFTYDFLDCPDLVIPVAVLCSALSVRGHFTGISNLRYKESDRLAALKEELKKIGTDFSYETDSAILIPSEFRQPQIIRSHNDHRMAMAFSTLSLISEVSIDDPAVVNKSYPEFWDQMEAAGFIIKY